MAEQDIKAMICDGCGKVFPKKSEDDIIPGFYGTVTEHRSTGGGEGDDWFACKPAHIKQAVLNVIQRSRDSYSVP